MSSEVADHFDILIVGGGVIGLSLAWELAQRDAEVCVVDRGSLGQEASWAGAGMLPPGAGRSHWHAASPLEQLEGLSQELHSQWHEKLLEATGIDNEYRSCGALQLAFKDQDADRLRSQAEHWRELGIDCQPVDAAIVADLEPALAASANRLAASYVLPEEAQIRNPRHLRALIKACTTQGVHLRPHTSVRDFGAEGDKILNATTDLGRITASHFCLASGSWSGQLARKLGCDLPVRPVRGQIALLRGEQGAVRRNVNVGPRYLVPRRDGRLLVGSTQEDVGFDKSTTKQGIRQLIEFAADLAKPTSDWSLESTWAGLRPATADGTPWIGRMAAYSNGWVAAGHFRAGLQLSPATAVVMRALMLNEQPPVRMASCPDVS
ncbi:MAG: glycine oxidase ThiO [Planctomycetota bacterium]